jgi:hypothetical protein
MAFVAGISLIFSREGPMLVVDRAIADNLAANPGLRRGDIVVSLVEVKAENWSFGNGIAQYA